MKTDWINVADSLPDDDVDVLIYVLERGPDYRVAARVDGHWMTPGMCLIRSDKVSHWQPLEPPADSAAAGETPEQGQLRQTGGRQP
jgi:hypothetical protein